MDCIFCNFPLVQFIERTNIIEVVKTKHSECNQIDTASVSKKIIEIYVKYLSKQLPRDEMKEIVMDDQKYLILHKYCDICEKCFQLYFINSIKEVRQDISR